MYVLCPVSWCFDILFIFLCLFLTLLVVSIVLYVMIEKNCFSGSYARTIWVNMTD